MVLESRHSSKQLYRDPVFSGLFGDGDRAAWVMKKSYIPTIQALSARFGNEVGYWLIHDANASDPNPTNYTPSSRTHFTSPVKTDGEFDHMISSFKNLMKTMGISEESEIEKKIISFTIESSTSHQDDPRIS